MKRLFLDTNILLRLTTEDIESQAKKVKNIFIDASKGKHIIFTSSLVIFEYIWTLNRGYKYPSDAVISNIQKFIDMEFFEIENQDIIEVAIEIYKNENVEIQDCFNLTFAARKNSNKFITFDKKLAKVAKKYDL